MYTSVIPIITAFKYLSEGKLYINCKLLIHIIIIIIIILLLLLLLFSVIVFIVDSY